MTEERPEALLKSALEKIIYFEARSEALHHDLEAARDEAARLKAELAQAATREGELRRRLAEAEVQVGRAHRDREELARLNEALRGERAALIDKLVEASRIHAGDAQLDDGFDLAGFIALLRSESMRAAAPGAVATVAENVQVTAPSSARIIAEPVRAAVAATVEPSRAGNGVTEHAQRFRAEGRLEVKANDVLALSRDRGELAGRTEETLFGFSLRELVAPEASARLRAAERLQALGATAAAPTLASALNHERDPGVLVALLNAFAQLAGEQGVPVVLPHLESQVPNVRTAALKALLAVDPTRAVPHLSAALKDPDASVRRRASLLTLGLAPEVALRLGEETIHDADEEARSLGALALGASSGERARSLLLEALKDTSEKVRRSAARALSSILGEDVSAVATLPDAQRRREIRRLASLPVRPSLARSGSASKLEDPVAAARARIAARASAEAQRSGTSSPAEPVLAATDALRSSSLVARSGADTLRPSVAVARSGAEVSPDTVDRATLLQDAVEPATDRAPHWIETLCAQIADEPAPVWMLNDPEKDTEVELVTPETKPLAVSSVATRILASTPVEDVRGVVHAPVYATVGAGGPSRAPTVPASSVTRAIAAAAAPSRTPDGLAPKLLSSILTQLRRSQRGLTLPDLASTLDAPAPQVNAACSELLRRGDVVRRGIKYFVA